MLSERTLERSLSITYRSKRLAFNLGAFQVPFPRFIRDWQTWQENLPPLAACPVSALLHPLYLNRPMRR